MSDEDGGEETENTVLDSTDCDNKVRTAVAFYLVCLTSEAEKKGDELKKSDCSSMKHAKQVGTAGSEETFIDSTGTSM